ncbi:MAG: hypothetical protein C5S43_02035 [Candidatus Methanocomedens sp.]|nr:MAG: hypothetical protein C5S43_02035 [ANME-2 cluster archaeon]
MSFCRYECAGLVHTIDFIYDMQHIIFERVYIKGPDLQKQVIGFKQFMYLQDIVYVSQFVDNVNPAA